MDLFPYLEGAQLDIKKKATRTKINEWLNANKDKVDGRDVEKLDNNDWWLWNFLHVHEYNVDAAAKYFCKHLAWRKEHGVNDLNAAALKPFLEANTMYIRGKSVDGRNLLWFNIRHTVQDSNITVKQRDKRNVMLFWLERQWWSTNGDGAYVIFDMHDTGLRHIDMSNTKWLLHVLQYHYPGILWRQIAYNMPWVLQASWKIVRGWFDPRINQLIYLVNDEEVKKYIPDDASRPPHMHGTDNYHFCIDDLSFDMDKSQTSTCVTQKDLVDVDKVETFEQPPTSMAIIGVVNN